MRSRYAIDLMSRTNLYLTDDQSSIRASRVHGIPTMIIYETNLNLRNMSRRHADDEGKDDY